MLQSIPSLMVTRTAFSPTNIAGLRFWIKSDSLSLNDGDLVATWADSSGSGFTLTAAGIRRPTFKTAIQNGRAVVRFDGVGNGMDTGVASIATQPNTIYIAASQTSTSTRVPFLLAGQQEVYLQETTGFLHAYAGTELIDSTNHSGAFHVITVIFDGASSFVYLDGSLILSGNAGTDNCINLNVGIQAGVFFLTGDIGEELIYNGAHSSTDRDNVQGYLKSRWGTP